MLDDEIPAELADSVAILAKNLEVVMTFAATHTTDDGTRLMREEEIEAYIEKKGWTPTVGKSTISRAKLGKTPIQIDKLATVARCFGLQAWQLLVPGLDPANPPTLPITETEKDFWVGAQEGIRRIRERERQRLAEASSGSDSGRGDHPSQESRKKVVSAKRKPTAKTR